MNAAYIGRREAYAIDARPMLLVDANLLLDIKPMRDVNPILQKVQSQSKPMLLIDTNPMLQVNR